MVKTGRDTKSVCRKSVTSGNLRNNDGNIKTPMQNQGRDEKFAKETGDKLQEKKLGYNLVGPAYYRLSDFKNAIDYHERDLKLAKRVGDVSGEATAYDNLGCAYYSLGDFKKAIDYDERYLKIAKKLETF